MAAAAVAFFASGDVVWWHGRRAGGRKGGGARVEVDKIARAVLHRKKRAGQKRRSTAPTAKQNEER